MASVVGSSLPTAFCLTEFFGIRCNGHLSISQRLNTFSILENQNTDPLRVTNWNYLKYIPNTCTCTKYLNLYTRTCTKNLYKIPVYPVPVSGTGTNHMYQIPRPSTWTKYLYPVPVPSSCTQYLYSVPVPSTCTNYTYL